MFLETQKKYVKVQENQRVTDTATTLNFLYLTTLLCVCVCVQNLATNYQQHASYWWGPTTCGDKE